jgi:hypothetical protein
LLTENDVAAQDLINAPQQKAQGKSLSGHEKKNVFPELAAKVSNVWKLEKLQKK